MNVVITPSVTNLLLDTLLRCSGGVVSRAGVFRQRATSAKVRAVAHVCADAPLRVTTSVRAPNSMRVVTVSV
jgi:hypothetical protein